MTMKTCAAIAAVMAGAVAFADETAAGWSYEAGAGLSYGEAPVVTGEAGLSFDSRYMMYGVIDGKDPIVTPTVSLTFFDWAYAGVDAIFDTTKGNGKRGGYGNRAGKYTLLYANAGLAHEFDAGETLGTLGVDFCYTYMYIPRNVDDMGDSQYLTLELSLGDLWLEPTLTIERDIMADNGTYVRFEVGHTFELTDALTLRPSVGQGFGNSLRTKGYFSELEKVEGFDHGGLMDTTIRLDLEYALTDWLTFGAYVAYYDYLFDGNMRKAAAAYNGEWGASCDQTWNFVGGLSVTATF
jgi:outer membrane scaffolding protein for murein synthesis (MipA/OmpV family)